MRSAPSPGSGGWTEPSSIACWRSGRADRTTFEEFAASGPWRRRRERRVVAAGKKAEETGAKAESRIAKRASLWAGASSLLVILVAATTFIGLYRTRADLEQVRKETVEQSTKFLERLEEVRQAALAAQRVRERPPEVPEATSPAEATLQHQDDARPRMNGKLWPVGHTLRVRLLGGTPEQHRQVEEWSREWLKDISLHLEFSNREDAEIRIAFETGGGAWAYEGKDALRAAQKLDQTFAVAQLLEATPGIELGTRPALPEHSEGLFGHLETLVHGEDLLRR